MQTRRQEVSIKPGYDGVYGIPKFSVKRVEIRAQADEGEHKEKMRPGKEAKEKDVKVPKKSEKDLLKEQMRLQQFLQSHQG